MYMPYVVFCKISQQITLFHVKPWFHLLLLLTGKLTYGALIFIKGNEMYCDSKLIQLY